MKAKEKAKELVEGYYNLLHAAANYDNDHFDQSLWDVAKECALIAVDEIISALVGLTSLKYWEDVKQEILKKIFARRQEILKL